MTDIPSTQQAIEFVGKDEIRINTAKPVDPVGPTQMLLKIEACGICFSDTKLLHAFESHPRKSMVVGGLSGAELADIPSYHPDRQPVTPGHEPVGRVVAVGERVTHFALGDRVLVQADWKHIPTVNSNAAFGYNFDGALQEYVVVDERCVVGPDGEEFLIHVADDPSAAAIGLIEPWATVEASYASRERNHVIAGGHLLVVGDGDIDALIVDHRPGEIVRTASAGEAVRDAAGEAGGSFTDIVYFGADAAEIEALIELMAPHAVLCVVLDGRVIDRAVSIDVGSIHYNFLRFCGTAGADPREGYAWLPTSSEVRDHDAIAIVGAAGPMGTMHTIRNVVLDRAGLEITATDLSSERLAKLRTLVDSRAAAHGVSVSYLNTNDHPLEAGYSYLVCLVPVPAVVANLVELAAPGAIVNAFAGIPVGSPYPINLQRVIEDHIFIFGTSGSDVNDMRTVVRKIEAGLIDTHISLDAITGIAGFRDAIQAVMDRTSGGKIMVFPQLHDLPYTRLSELAERLPAVASHLNDGVWTKQAEAALLDTALPQTEK